MHKSWQRAQQPRPAQHIGLLADWRTRPQITITRSRGESISRQLLLLLTSIQADITSFVTVQPQYEPPIVMNDICMCMSVVPVCTTSIELRLDINNIQRNMIGRPPKVSSRIIHFKIMAEVETGDRSFHTMPICAPWSFTITRPSVCPLAVRPSRSTAGLALGGVWLERLVMVEPVLPTAQRTTHK